MSCSRARLNFGRIWNQSKRAVQSKRILGFFLIFFKNILRISVGQTLWKCLFLTVKSRESTSISAKIFASGGRYPSETTVRGHQTDQTIDTGLVLLVHLYLYEWYIVSKFISLVFIIYNSVSICKQLLTSEFWSIYSLNTAAAPSEEFRTKQPIIFQECRNLLSLLGIPLISVCAHILHLYTSGCHGARWSKAFHYRYKPFDITSRKLALTSKLSLANYLQVLPTTSDGRRDPGAEAERMTAGWRRGRFSFPRVSCKSVQEL